MFCCVFFFFFTKREPSCGLIYKNTLRLILEPSLKIISNVALDKQIKT